MSAHRGDSERRPGDATPSSDSDDSGGPVKPYDGTMESSGIAGARSTHETADASASDGTDASARASDHHTTVLPRASTLHVAPSSDRDARGLPLGREAQLQKASKVAAQSFPDIKAAAKLRVRSLCLRLHPALAGIHAACFPQQHGSFRLQRIGSEMRAQAAAMQGLHPRVSGFPSGRHWHDGGAQAMMARGPAAAPGQAPWHPLGGFAGAGVGGVGHAAMPMQPLPPWHAHLPPGYTDAATLQAYGLLAARMVVRS